MTYLNARQKKQLKDKRARRRKQYFYRNLEKRLRSAGLWRKFHAEYLHLWKTRTHPKCKKQRRWQIWQELTQKPGAPYYDAAGYEEVEKGYKEWKRKLRENGKKKKVVAIKRKLPKNKVDQIAAIAKQREKLSRHLRRRKALGEAMRERLENTADDYVERFQKAREAYFRKRLDQMTKREEMEQEVRDVVEKNIRDANKIKIKGDGETDILRDVKWVYDNYAELIQTDPKTGADVLNNDLLKKAPSSGCVAIAQYALLDKAKFFERFVVRILPKDDGPAKDKKDTEETAEELDPDFADMEKWIQG